MRHLSAEAADDVGTPCWAQVTVSCKPKLGGSAEEASCCWEGGPEAQPLSSHLAAGCYADDPPGSLSTYCSVPDCSLDILWSSRSSQLSEIYLAKWYFWRSPSIGSLQLSIICLARPVVFGTINFYFLLQIPPFVLRHCLVLGSFIWWYLDWLFSFFQLTVSLHFVLGHFLLFGLGVLPSRSYSLLQGLSCILSTWTLSPF